MMPKPSLVPLLKIADQRGELYCCEHRVGSNFPFDIKRMFYIKNVPFHVSRGGHAHFHCHQFITAAAGRVMVRTNNGTEKEEFLLVQPSPGLYIPPMVWCQLNFSEDAVCIVMASELYSEADYIRTYDQFLAEADRFVVEEVKK